MRRAPRRRIDAAHRRRLADRRIRLLLGVLTLVFALSLGRAAWLQGVRAGPLARMAESQHRETLAIPATRGTIYDRTGSQLALGERATAVYADPRQVRRPGVVARAAALTLGIDAGRAYRLVTQRGKRFVYLARQVDAKRAARLERQRLAGLGFLAEERRTYPQRSLGAHVVGFAGIDNRGIAGLESQFERALAGRPGVATIVRDPIGRVLDVLSTTPERDGRDVWLTLDHNIQARAEAVLRATVARWRARSATAVVLDPRSGAVLAMAVAPGFDANRFAATPPERTRNRAVTDVYEPGSTFKLITVAGVLSDRLVSPRTAYTLPYSMTVADRVIHDSHSRPTERMTVAQILARSSNVGTVTLGQLLGRRRLVHWIDRFGFGKPTGIDFPGEEEGLVLPAEEWSGSTIGNIPIGQGIGVTPIQMAAAYAAVANDGVAVTPHLLARVAGTARRAPAKRRVVSARVARTLVEMLKQVVLDGGTGTEAQIPGYTVAGKTGTAEKAGPNGYNTGRYVASFVGFVPASKPRIVVLVTVDEPKDTIWGGVVAAPAFAEIARFGVTYLDVAPDAPLPPR